MRPRVEAGGLESVDVRQRRRRLDHCDLLLETILDTIRRANGHIRQRYERETVLEENYRRPFTYHPHPMWVYDPETCRFLAVTEAVAHYGCSPEEFFSPR
jgi:hypothetical protein